MERTMGKRQSGQRGGWRRWTEADARAAIAEWQSSGDSASAYAGRRGISPQRLYRWASRLSGDVGEASAAPRFVAVRVVDGDRAWGDAPRIAARVSVQVGEVHDCDEVPAWDGELTYRLDAEGRRIATERTASGSSQPTEYFIYGDALHPIARLDAERRLSQLYVYREGHHSPTAMIAYNHSGTGPARTEFSFVNDPRGSVRLVVRLDDGEVVRRVDYGPFGEVILDTSPGFQPFGYAGGIYDADTGLVRFGARDYDPETGRWMTRDPIGFAGGDTNLYAYVGGDPVNLVDPTGLIVWGPILTRLGPPVCGCLLNVAGGVLGGTVDSWPDAGQACVVGAAAAEVTLIGGGGWIPGATGGVLGSLGNDFFVSDTPPPVAGVGVGAFLGGLLGGTAGRFIPLDGEAEIAGHILFNFTLPAWQAFVDRLGASF
jgi:RHS repeat-associated protein